LKIIYLHQYFNTPEMSGGTRSYEMARRLVAAGHEVHIVTSIREPNHQHNDWFVTKEAGIQVHWYPVPYSNHMRNSQRIRAFLSFATAALKKAVELEGDVIFASSTPLTIALPAVPAARKKKIPMAIGALNNPLLRFAAHRLEHWAYKNAAAIVALSPGMKNGVVAKGYPAEKVAVIPNSSDNQEFSYDANAARLFRAERAWLADRPLLVYTGTFGKVNGVGYMVELASALLARGSDVRILLVGNGAERDSITQAAEQAGVYQNNLFIEDPLPKKDMPALLSAANMASVLFIDLPEMRPNSANKFFDALASGTPVLLNYGGWMHDLVSAHKCGMPMWQRSVVEVAEEVDLKMHDQAWLDKAGLAARTLAEEYFDRDLLADQLMMVLDSAVNGTPHYAQRIAPGEYA
jgi:glycosyltransferase involved in cell wall biosynthesis